MKRMQLLKIEDAITQTTVHDNIMELINYSLHDVDLGLFLSSFNWNKLEILKLVKTGLSDNQLNTLLNHVLNSKVHTLVLSNNNLS